MDAFLAFKRKVADARLHHKEHHESLPHHERFGRLLSGSGSDTAEVIRTRHAFMLSEIYPHIKLVSRDPNRSFGPLEREVIWNRDRGQCQNLKCSRPDRRVSFREATIHHIVEHTAGGRTTPRNGVLICPACHANRAGLQESTQYLQEYIARIYDGPQTGASAPPPNQEQREFPDERNGSSREGIKVEIDWGALDVDRCMQTVRKDNDTDTIVELLRLLLDAFGKPMRDQLLESPIVRFPLSTNPAADFLNRSQNRPYSYSLIPGTDLYFCGQSQRSEKIQRLKALFSRLTLPGGGEFPDECIKISAESDK